MITDWKQQMQVIEPKARLTSGATDERISSVEKAIGVRFPADLRSLFLQTNGILDDGFGPILSLSTGPATPFADSAGNPAAPPFPTHDYSVEQYTLVQRKLWEEDSGVRHDNFVVLGLDVGGNPFGFFAGPGETVRIKAVEHDDGSIGKESYGLEEYLRFYFEECRWFEDED